MRISDWSSDVCSSDLRVVDGAAEPAIAADPFHRQELAVAARNQQQQKGEGQPVAEPRRQRMAFQVVHREKRLVPGERDGLGRHHADEDAADQARAGSSEENTYELQSLMRISYHVFCL